MKNKSSNFLDFVPVINEKLEYSIEDGRVTIHKENRGLFNFIAQKLLHKPRVSHIHLDEMGSFIWPLIDGQRSIMAIAALFKEEFGEKAEPLYNRVVQYFKTLKNCDFVDFM